VIANIRYASRDNPIDQAAIFHNQRNEGRFIRLIVDGDEGDGGVGEG
jgi:hypothetical protein